MSRGQAGRDIRRGCGILLVGLPVVGVCAVGAGGVALAVLLLWLMLIGCSAPPLTVGYIAYPPHGTRVTAGEVELQVWAYRRDWATLHFDSGWSSSTRPPEALRLEVDGRPVFTWSHRDSEEKRWNPGIVPVSLPPGEHTVHLVVEGGGVKAVDTIIITAEEAHPWQVWSIPGVEEPGAEDHLLVDVDGNLWRAALVEKPEPTFTVVEAISPPLSAGEYQGPLLRVDGRQVHLFNLEDGRTYTLTTNQPLPPEAAFARVLVRTDGETELFWDTYRPLQQWDGTVWQPTEARLPVRPSFSSLLRLNWRAPDDAWVMKQHAARWDGSTWHPVEPPVAGARFLRDGVALAGNVFYFWDGQGWQATAEFPPTPDPFALDFAALGDEQRVVRCGGELWFVGNASSWNPDDSSATRRLRIWRWDGHQWTWEEVFTGQDTYARGELACVGSSPWLIVTSASRVLTGTPQAVNRFGGRFLGPESKQPMDGGQMWWWNGSTWERAVQPPFWGEWFFNVARLSGEGLGYLSRATGRVTVARVP